MAARDWPSCAWLAPAGLVGARVGLGHSLERCSSEDRPYSSKFSITSARSFVSLGAAWLPGLAAWLVSSSIRLHQDRRLELAGLSGTLEALKIKASKAPKFTAGSALKNTVAGTRK